MTATVAAVAPNPRPAAAVNVVRQWDDGQLLVPDRHDVLPWDLALEHLAQARLFWHVTRRPDAHAHVRPVFAVEVDGMLWFTTSPGTRKTRLVQRHPRCSLAASADGIDVVYEGIAVEVHEPDCVARVADAYRRTLLVRTRRGRGASAIMHRQRQRTFARAMAGWSAADVATGF